MKKLYIAPQNKVVSSRIRTSILAGSNSTPGAPNASGSTNLNDGTVQDYNPTNDGGLGANRRINAEF